MTTDNTSYDLENIASQSSGEKSRIIKNEAPIRIMVANAKGGCGKTTVATNLASFMTHNGHKTALIDYDPQCSAIDWLKDRDQHLPNIHGVAAAQRANPMGSTRSWALKVPGGTTRIICDTPAGLTGNELSDLIHHADIIIIPVIPSTIDIRAVTFFIKDVLLSYAFRVNPKPIAVVANRVRKNTIIYGKLERFLATLSIPFIASFRDTQYYVRASENGLGLVDLGRMDEKDKKEWKKLLDWIDASIEQKRPSPPAE